MTARLTTFYFLVHQKVELGDRTINGIVIKVVRSPMLGVTFKCYLFCGSSLFVFWSGTVVLPLKMAFKLVSFWGVGILLVLCWFRGIWMLRSTYFSLKDVPSSFSSSIMGQREMLENGWSVEVDSVYHGRKPKKLYELIGLLIFHTSCPQSLNRFLLFSLFSPYGQYTLYTN